MHNIVRKHIKGEISMDEVRRLIDELKKEVTLTIELYN